MDRALDRRRLAPILSFLACLGALAATGFAAASAQAAEKHLFDPVLSLGGTCSTSTIDGIDDPGCPDDHPPKGFENACGTATDPHGYIYVASAEIRGSGGRIDVFDPQGTYLTEIGDGKKPCSLALDSEGNVYATEYIGHEVVRFEPKAYPPQQEAEYEPPVIVHQVPEVPPFENKEAWSVAVDPSNDRVYVGTFGGVDEYASAAEGSGLIAENVGGGLGVDTKMIAVYGRNHEIYIASTKPGSERDKPENSRVLMLDGSGAVQRECEVPDAGPFIWNGAIAVDQANGDAYLENLATNQEVEQFGADCHFIGKIEEPRMAGAGSVPALGIAVDGSCETEASEPCQATYDSPNAGYLFVAQGETQSSNPPAHLYAFAPREVGPPEIESQAAAGITETEAVLETRLNPHGLATRYRFEYTTQSAYEIHGYEGATPVPVPAAGTGEGGAFVNVKEPISGLEPGTAYRFRLLATNCEAEEAIAGECETLGEGKPGEEGKDAGFATYAADAGLPDGRAYELVTPPETNGRIPTMSELAHNNDLGFDTLLASPDGESVVWGVQGGSLPDLGGGGFNDTYEALRGQGGWQSRFTGLGAAQAPEPYAGGVSPEHEYSFWYVERNEGSLVQGFYLRGPDGEIEPIGVGRLSGVPVEDRYAVGKWIAPHASRVIFATQSLAGEGVLPPVPLADCAPPAPIEAVYDRAPGGPTRCVSLLPGNLTPTVDARFQLASADGEIVVFSLREGLGEAEGLYVRLGDDETQLIATGLKEDSRDNRTSFVGGVSQDGGRIVYLRHNPTQPRRPNPSEPAAAGIPQGEILLYDTRTETTESVGSGDESALVNVSPDASHVYFVSPQELNSGSEGEDEGEENLYAWDTTDPASSQFVGVLTPRDVEGELAKFSSNTMTDGLGLWLGYAVSPYRGEFNGLGADPSRSTPDGSVFVFGSRAELTAYENAGHAEIYRYDTQAAPGERLKCVSCNPTGVPAQSNALLQTPYGGQFVAFPPTNALARIQNVTDDGRRVIFQSSDRLVNADLDAKQDVYEWEAQGTDGCQREAGCIHLLSAGQSAANDYLYAMTPNGSDVFFESGDLLVAQDLSATPSIYDAREPHLPGEAVGFPPPGEPPAPCAGEACQPLAALPSEPAPASSSFDGAGNPPAHRRCHKGSARPAGRRHCSRHRKRHRRRHRGSHAKGREGR